MPNLAQTTQITGAQVYDYGTTQLHPLGTIGQTKDGRKFRYVKAGGSALVVGNAIQSPAVVPNHLALTPVATVIGDTSITVALGATLATANQYAEGYVGVSVTPDLGRAYTISGHPAAAQSANLTLKLDAADPIQVAWTTSSRVGLFANPYNGVIQFPVTTATGTLVGIAVSAIAASSFGWVQVYGLGFPLIAGTPALGAMIMSPGTTAGASVIVTTTNLVVAQFLGRMAQIGVAGECDGVFLDID